MATITIKNEINVTLGILEDDLDTTSQCYDIPNESGRCVGS